MNKAESKQAESIDIRSGQGDYKVLFFSDVTEALKPVLSLKNAVVLVDANIAKIYAHHLKELVSKYPTLEIPATEDEKTWAGLENCLAFFQKHNATKQTQIITIGGGIIQDIACFASHVYYRGVKWIFLPTTLLAQCDSCIGAKCGINFGPYKNQLGVFNSPAQVIVCSEFLKTLSDADVVSGYGEIQKLLITGDKPGFERLKIMTEKEGPRNSELLEFIRASLLVKKQVIEEDEYEKDLRRILNYGHTFGHALEAITNHAVPHGIAVGIGCDLVNFLALKRGILSKADFDSMHEYLVRFFRFGIKQQITGKQLIDATRRDKKILDGKINLIFAERIGKLGIYPTSYDAQLEREVAEYLEQTDVLYWS